MFSRLQSINVPWLNSVKISSLLGTKETDESNTATESTPLVSGSPAHNHFSIDTDFESGDTAPTSASTKTPSPTNSAFTTDSAFERKCKEEVGSKPPGISCLSVATFLISTSLCLALVAFESIPFVPSSWKPTLKMSLGFLGAIIPVYGFFFGSNITLDKMYRSQQKTSRTIRKMEIRAKKRDSELKGLHQKLDELLGHGPTLDMDIEFRRYPVDKKGLIQKDQTEKKVLLLKSQMKQCNTGAEILEVARNENEKALKWEIDADLIGTKFEIKYIISPALSQGVEIPLSSRQFNNIPKQDLFDLFRHNDDDRICKARVVKVVLERITE